MTDREFINKLINNYFSHSIDAHQATFHNAITNRLNEIADKLDKYKEYKNLEEQIGCSFDILFKALTDGVWVEVDPIDISFENPETMYLEEFVSLEKKLDGTLCLNARDYVDELELKDYKKTWWLKKDKSE